MKFLIWLGVVLIVLLVWLNVPDPVWRYLFHLRPAILAGAFLFGLPFLSVTLLRAMLRNLFVLRGMWQIAFVIIGAVIAGLSVALVANIILSNGQARFGLPFQLTLPEWGQYLLAIGLALPTIYFAIQLSKERLDVSSDACEPEKPDGRTRWTGVATGAGLSVVLIGLVSLTRHWLEANLKLQEPLLQLLSFLTKQETQGYVDPEGGLAIGHTTALAFLLIELAVYLIISRLFRPQPSSRRPEAPALLFVMLIITGATLLAGGLTFFFDFYKILPLLLFVTASAIVYGLFKVDHYYTIVPTERNLPPGADDFAAILRKRLQHQTGEKTLVLVCASGGGIQASGWTVQVLTGLQQLLGKSFTQATGLISSASGGSVGTMYFLDRFNLDQGCPDEADIDPVLDGNRLDRKQTRRRSQRPHTIFESATSDSLDAVGWGLTVLDLWRLAGWPFLIHPLFDRGTAVETDWTGELHHKNATLERWRQYALDGKMPIPVFNATLVENGFRFLISPMSFIRDDQQSTDNKVTDYNALYGNYDMSVATAARLSATFPYVSPICRPYVNDDKTTQFGLPQFKPLNLKKVAGYHVADGGYFDNSGVFTVVKWLNRLLETNQIPDIKRIVIVQINAFPADLPNQKDKTNPENLPTGKDKSDGGWATALLGPLFTTFRVRDSTLIARNESEIQLLQDRWQDKGVTIEHVPIYFPSFEQIKQEVNQKLDPKMQQNYSATQANKNQDKNQGNLPLFSDGKYSPPLSWKLTHIEKKAIQYAWQIVVNDDNSEVQKLRQLWQEWGMGGGNRKDIC